jgi:Ca2+-binding EF-hand superfamily protein
MRRLAPLLLLAGLLTLGTSASAQVLPPAAATPRTSLSTAEKDHLDFLFLASDRPVLLRVHARNGNRPYFAAWEDYMDKMFAYFDVDGDGKLSAKEVKRVPNGQFLQYQVQGVIGLGFMPAQMDQLDTNKDGKVSREELRAYYRTNGLPPMMLSDQSTRATTTQVTRAIYRRLDTNRDYRLTEAELKQAPPLLASLDSNEDESLTADELLGKISQQNYYYSVGFGGDGQGLKPESGLIAIQPETAIPGLAGQMLSKYDRNKDGKLTREESGLEAALFKKLDSNGDGKLTTKELAGFFGRDADLELVVRVGPLVPTTSLAGALLKVSSGLGISKLSPQRAELFNPNKRDMPLAARLRTSGQGTASIELGDTDLSLVVPDNPMGSIQGTKQFYVQQFDQSDTNKKGFLTRQQANNGFLGQLFELLDRNGDGKLYRKEMTEFFDIQDLGTNCRLSLTVNDQGRSLFNLLDASGDGRLSHRELRDGWARLKAHARSKEGLARGDIPRRIQVQVGSGMNQYYAAPVAVVVSYAAISGAPAQAQKPPRWFASMDRNHDMDLSQREFLGPEEVFRKIDRDGDGLISVAEALRYEQQLKLANLKKQVNQLSSEVQQLLSRRPDQRKP